MKTNLQLYDYKYFRASKPFQNNLNRLNQLVSAIEVYQPKTVLDVGCGLGVLVRALRRKGIEAIGTDFAPILKEKAWKRKQTYLQIAEASDLPFPDKSFDVVFSSDFFEHIPDEEIDQIVSEMKRVGKKVIARVCYEMHLTEKQAKYHVTNKPKEWWVKRLEGIELV